MLKLRKGNNLSIRWKVEIKNYDAIISQSSIRLFLVNALKEKQEIINFNYEDNFITFTILGKDQCKWRNGKYHLLLVLNACTENQLVLDKRDVFILMEVLDNKIIDGTSDYIDADTGIEIESIVSKDGEPVDLTVYVTETELNTILQSYAQKSEISNFITLDELLAKDYATKAFCSQMIIDAVTGGTIDLTPYVAKSELNEMSYVTKSYLSSKNYLTEHQDLSSYATQSYVSEKINEIIIPETDNLVSYDYLSSMGYLTEHQDLSDYVTKQEANSYITSYISENYYNKLETHQLLNDYVRLEFEEEDIVFKSSPAYNITAQDITNWNNRSQFSGSYNDLTDKPDLDRRYVSYTYLNNKNYITGSEVDLKIENIDIPDVSNFVDYSYLADKHYISEHQDISNLASKQYVDTAVNNVTVDTSNLVSKTELIAQTYTTKDYVDNALAGVVLTETDPIFNASAAKNISASGVAAANKIQYIDANGKLSFNSDVNSEDGYLATENYVLSQISQVDNIVVKLTQDQYDFLQENGLINENKMYLITDAGDSVVSFDDIDDFVSYTYLGNKLSGYYTKAETEALLANVSGGGTVDLTGYGDKTWVQNYINSLNHVSAIQLNTKAAETLQAAYNYADTISTNGVDLTNYATKSYVTNKLNNYATQSDIPDISGLASRTWVNNNFMEKTNIDLTPYATISYTTNYYALKSEIPSLAGYATSSEVNTKTSEIKTLSYNYTDNQISNIILPDVSGFVTYAYLADKINEIVIEGADVDLSSYATKELVSSYLLKTDAASLYQPKGTYMTAAYIDTNYAKKSEIPDVTGFATISYVTEKTNNIDISYIVWTGTQTEYNALSDKTQYQIYLIKQNG